MQIFNINGPLFRFLEKVANLIILNLLLLICSLPIVTIGPALTATYYVNLKMLRGEDPSIIKSFFHSFRANFRQGLVIGLGVILLAVLFLLDIYVLTYLVSIPEAIAKILIVIISVFLVVLALIAIYVFAVLAQFDNKTTALIKWSVALAISHFPVTLISVVIAALPIILLYFFPNIFIQFVLPIMMLMGFSGISFLQSYFYVRVFDYYIPKNEDEAEEE